MIRVTNQDDPETNFLTDALNLHFPLVTQYLLPENIRNLFAAQKNNKINLYLWEPFYIVTETCSMWLYFQPTLQILITIVFLETSFNTQMMSSGILTQLFSFHFRLVSFKIRHKLHEYDSKKWNSISRYMTLGCILLVVYMMTLFQEAADGLMNCCVQNTWFSHLHPFISFIFGISAEPVSFISGLWDPQYVSFSLFIHTQSIITDKGKKLIK